MNPLSDNLQDDQGKSRPGSDPVVTSPLRAETENSADLKFVRKLIARDESSWMEFITRYDRLVKATIRSALSSTGWLADPDDAVGEIRSEIYAALVDGGMRTLRSFNGRSRLSTWLSVIVRRMALKQISGMIRHPRNADPELFEQLVASRSEQTGTPIPDEDLARLRQRLSKDDQLVLRLFYDENLKYEEIAETMAISANAVGPKLNRARQRLRSLLERPPDG